MAEMKSNPADDSAFANLILPGLKKNCTTCHGPQKSKAGLRLDSFATLQKGGEHGSAVKPGDVAHSLFLQAMLKPVGSDEHMPPAGKPQPTADEIALLKWWVESGASATKTLAELQPPTDLLKIINAPR